VKPLFAATLFFALLVLAAACRTQEEARSPTPTPTATEKQTPTAEPSPLASPLAVAGITVYPSKMWFDGGRSLCASDSLEAPFFGPEAFSVRVGELPKLDLPAKPADVRVCSDGISAIGYIGDGYVVLLVNGPHEWPTGADRERISAGTVAGRPAVLVAPAQPGQYRGAMVIVAEEFGLTVVRASSLQEAKQIAEGLHGSQISLPEVKGSYTGPLNGIRFYNNLHGNNRKEGCAWGAYGVEDPRADGTVIPPGTPLDIVPSYLPAGYSLEEKHATSCGTAIDLVDANFRRDDGVSLVVWRLSGEPAWYSVYSQDWLTAGTVDGRPAVFIGPPSWASQADVSVQVVVSEEFGLTVVTGQVPLEEAKRVAEGLNRRTNAPTP